LFMTTSISLSLALTLGKVRHGFELCPNTPAFYPPVSFSHGHNKHNSIFSIASLSSYGSVIHSTTTPEASLPMATRPASFAQSAHSVNTVVPSSRCVSVIVHDSDLVEENDSDSDQTDAVITPLPRPQSSSTPSLGLKNPPPRQYTFFGSITSFLASRVNRNPDPHTAHAPHQKDGCCVLQRPYLRSGPTRTNMVYFRVATNSRLALVPASADILQLGLRTITVIPLLTLPQHFNPTDRPAPSSLVDSGKPPSSQAISHLSPLSSAKGLWKRSIAHRVQNRITSLFNLRRRVISSPVPVHLHTGASFCNT